MKTLVKKIVLFTLLLLENRLANCAATVPNIQDTVKQRAKEIAAREFLANNLRLFDGTAGTNQCHLNALMVAMLAKNEGFKNALRTNLLDGHSQQGLNFLANNLLLNFEFSNLGNTERVSALLTLLELQSNKKHKELLRGGSFITNAKKELTEEILEFFFSSIAQDLQVHLNNFPKSSNRLSIIPKFLGITNFLNFLKSRGDIWMILKCNTSSGVVKMAITPNQQNFITCDQIGLANTKPVIVIEGISNLNQEEFNAFLQTITPEQLQLAVAAEFNKCKQGDCLPLVEKLDPSIKDWISMAESMHITEAHPITFFIQHMFPDTFEHAIEGNL